jgi:hypothetical protein
MVTGRVLKKLSSLSRGSDMVFGSRSLFFNLELTRIPPFLVCSNVSFLMTYPVNPGRHGWKLSHF